MNPSPVPPTVYPHLRIVLLRSVIPTYFVRWVEEAREGWTEVKNAEVNKLYRDEIITLKSRRVGWVGNVAHIGESI